MEVKGKVIVVTGAGNGIGRALTHLLINKGARVAAVDISPEMLNETILLAGERGDRISTHAIDIRDRKAVWALPEQVIQAHGAVDGVINNAGIIQKFVKISELELSDLEKVMDVNYWGTVYMTKAFLPYLSQRPEAHIVNTSSMGGFLPVPGQTAYGATKAAVKLFTEGLHSELAGANVRITLAIPGATATNITGNSGIKFDAAKISESSAKIKMKTPQQAAAILVDAMEKDRYRVLIGSDTRLMDLLYRLMPEMAARIIADQIRAVLPV